MVFTNRVDAGRRLAARLADWRGRNAVVVAMPRGGVPVAVEVARAIEAPLDLVLVRKIGAPFQPELAIGAVVDGDEAETVLNDDVLKLMRLPKDYLDDTCREQLAVIERRRALYFADRVRPDVAGRPVILVDDGIATGATARAAIRGIRRKGPSHLVLAVPVAPPDSAAVLAREVDELVCLETPEPFHAIGQFYLDFAQVSDDEVKEMLAQHPFRDSESETAAEA